MKRPNRSQIVCSELMTKFNAAFWWNFSFSFYSLFFRKRMKGKNVPLIVGHLKSVNLKYNTLGRLDDGTKELSTKCLMFQVLFFFLDFLQNSLQKPFQFIFLFFYKITKIKKKSFEFPKSIKSIKKIILGTSDTSKPIHLFHCPCNPA